jgi:hypothetical protein
MEEKTLFKLARAITDTSTDNVSSKGGTVTYRITSLKRKLVNGKLVLITTPSCTLGSASISWATWGGVTVGEGYLDVKINYSENTGSSRSTTLTFDQDGSGNKINFTVTQESGVTYSGYIYVKEVSNMPLDGNKGDTDQITVMTYLKGSDGSKKSEPPHVGSAPDWCSVSVTQDTQEDHYILSLTTLSSNQTGTSRSGYIFLTCGDATRSIPVTQLPFKITVNIVVSVSKSSTSNTTGSCVIRSDKPVASDITFKLKIRYDVSSDDVILNSYILAKGSTISRNNFSIPNGANLRIIQWGHSPLEDSQYIYSAQII